MAPELDRRKPPANNVILLNENALEYVNQSGGFCQDSDMSKSTAMTKVRAEEIIAEMVQRIVEGFHPEMVVLFGSHARGSAGPDSDADLLVVMPVTGSRRDLTIKIRKALAGMGLAKDVVVATPEELDRHRNLVGTIVYPAMHEGRVVYERSA